MRRTTHGFGRGLLALDRRAFLGFQVWEFSWRSLGQRYGHTFLRRIVLRYPLRTLRGLLAYRRFVVAGSGERPVVNLTSGGLARFVQAAAEAGDGFLVATGFCQKPMARGEREGCPAGRANHLCHYLAHLEQAEAFHPACAACDIRIIGLRALRAGATMHIMTTALDIAHDLLLPTLAQGRFRQALLALCPYSVQPMALSLSICGIEAVLVTYGSGACADYTQWLQADRGMKPERTFIASEGHMRLLELLDEVSARRIELGRPPPRRFRLVGNLYLPSSSPRRGAAPSGLRSG